MQEVGGSIPPGSTSLRSLRELRLGKPRPTLSERSKRRLPRHGPKGDGGPQQAVATVKYVYIRESLDGDHFYVGITDDVPARLVKHNAGEVPHTSKYRPRRVRTYIAFTDEKLAVAFERYLKSGSGRAFAKKHL